MPAFMAASRRVRCSGVIFASCSSGMGISPVILGLVVTSHSPGLMFGWIICAAWTSAVRAAAQATLATAACKRFLGVKCMRALLRFAPGVSAACDDMPSTPGSPPEPHAIDAPYAAVSLQGRRLADELHLRQPLDQGRKRLLELRPGEHFPQTPMDAQPEDEVPARMIGAPDVEPVGIGVLARIAHGRQCREAEDVVARYDVTVNLDILQREPGIRSDHGLVAQRL